VTWATSVPILVFLGLSVLDLGLMYATDVRRTSLLNAPFPRGGGIIIVQHRLERQEMPQDPVPAETVSCSWTRDPTRTEWHSVPEVVLCPGALAM